MWFISHQKARADVSLLNFSEIHSKHQAAFVFHDSQKSRYRAVYHIDYNGRCVIFKCTSALINSEPNRNGKRESICLYQSVASVNLRVYWECMCRQRERFPPPSFTILCLQWSCSIIQGGRVWQCRAALQYIYCNCVTKGFSTMALVQHIFIQNPDPDVMFTVSECICRGESSPRTFKILKEYRERLRLQID